MAALRSQGSLSIAFGMVSIPVKLYSATTEAEKIKFNMLDKQGRRVRQQLVNEEGAALDRAEIQKGYEYQKDHYVTFTAEELKAMDETGTQTADVLEFVPAESVNALHFDKPYFLGPEQIGARAYTLFATALRKSGRVAIGKWAYKGKGKVVMIRPEGEGLVLQTLLYKNEVRSISDVTIPQVDVKDAELALAMQLIDASATDAFDPAKYKDEVAERVLAAVEQKVSNGTFSIAAEPTPTAQVIDLAEALKASIERKSKAPAIKIAAEAPKAKRAKKAAN